MRVIIIDKYYLQSIEPENMVKYLINTGWEQTTCYDLSTFNFFKKDGVTILVPLTKKEPFYSDKISLILEKLEKVENRSQLDIVEDIQPSCIKLRIPFIKKEIIIRNVS